MTKTTRLALAALCFTAVAPSFGNPFEPPSDIRAEVGELRDHVTSLQSVVDALVNRTNELAAQQAEAAMPKLGEDDVVLDEAGKTPATDEEPPVGSVYVGSSNGLYFYRTTTGDLVATSRKVRPVTATAAATEPKVEVLKIKGDPRAKVYHLPSCPGYATVSNRNPIDFTTEEEAKAAGFSRARNCK